MKWLLVLVTLMVNTAWAAIGNITESVNAPPSILRKGGTLPGGKGTGVEMMDAIKTAQGKVGISLAFCLDMRNIDLIKCDCNRITQAFNCALARNIRLSRI